MDEDTAVPEAAPGVDRRSRRSPVLFTAEVDGQRFAVRRSLDGGTDYEWLTGTDQGWATSDSPDRPYDAHVADLRESLRALAATGERHSAVAVRAAIPGDANTAGRETQAQG